MIARRTLREFWERVPDAEGALVAWFQEATAADWKEPSDIKLRYASASFLPGDRVVFNIKGNKYRLVVSIWYPGRAVYIRFVGTHAQYDRINAEEI